MELYLFKSKHREANHGASSRLCGLAVSEATAERSSVGVTCKPEVTYANLSSQDLDSVYLKLPQTTFHPVLLVLLKY